MPPLSDLLAGLFEVGGQMATETVLDHIADKLGNDDDEDKADDSHQLPSDAPFDQPPTSATTHT
ncbi:MAG: hypothetical protein Q4D91_05165 [Lautropia sp.]|nr:hypothetical protein [Lautropia sp.]